MRDAQLLYMLESLRRNWELDILQQQLFSPFFPFAHFLLGDPMAARWQWQWRGQWQGSGGWGATGLGSWCHLLRKVCFPITPFQMGVSSLLLHSAFLSNPTCQERPPQVNLLPTPFEIYKITFSFCCLPIEPRELHKWETKFSNTLNPARRWSPPLGCEA